MQKVIIDCEADPAVEALQALGSAKARYPELVKDFLQLVPNPAELLYIHSEAEMTRGTSRTTVRIQPSELLVKFLATLRALEFNRGLP